MDSHEGEHVNEVMKVRVVSRMFIVDMIAGIKNLFGMRINQYEKMIQNAKDEIWEELIAENVKLKWYRYEISQLTNGAMVVMFYGEAQ